MVYSHSMADLFLYSLISFVLASLVSANKLGVFEYIITLSTNNIL